MISTLLSAPTKMNTLVPTPDTSTSMPTIVSTPARPKRPLSAYNLFYRFKRGKIIKLQPHHGNGSDTHKEIVRQIVMAAPGLEEYPTIGNIGTLSSDDAMKELRRDIIRSALVDNLSPKDNSKRSHRKTHGAMSFLEMNKIMCSAWKSVDDFGRSVFEELAEEGKQDQLKRLAEYEKMYPNSSPAPKKKKKMDGCTQGRRASVDIGVVSRDQLKRVTAYHLDPSPKEKKMEYNYSSCSPVRRVSEMSSNTPQFGGLDLPSDDYTFGDIASSMNGPFAPPQTVPPFPDSPTSVTSSGMSMPFFCQEVQEPIRLKSDQGNRFTSSENEDMWDAKLPYIPLSSKEEDMLRNEVCEVSSDDFMKLIDSMNDNLFD